VGHGPQGWSDRHLLDRHTRAALLDPRRSGESLEFDLSALRDVPVTVSVQREAVRAMRELSAATPLGHRVPLPDLLIAAAAQEAGVGVLHLDRHFDRLAEVLAFDSRWAADPAELG